MAVHRSERCRASTGSQWMDPPVCTICSRSVTEAVSIPLSDHLSSYNLELLRVTDGFIIQNHVIQSMSPCFVFGSNVIDGFMLEKSGVKFQDSTSRCMTDGLRDLKVVVDGFSGFRTCWTRPQSGRRSYFYISDVLASVKSSGL